MWLEDPSYERLLYVCQNMREWDRKEIFATMWHDSPDLYAQELMGTRAAGGIGWIAGIGDEPIAWIGALPMWPNVVSVGMFATESFPKIGLSLTKFVKQRMIPSLVQAGVHRGQCFSMKGHHEAHSWLEMLGARMEAEVLDFGKNRETFFLYSWNPKQKPK